MSNVAIVGTAYVEIRAVTDKINSDIDRSLTRQNKSFEDAGKRYSEAIQRGFREGAVDLGQFAPDVDTSGIERGTRQVETSVRRTRTTVESETRSISNAFSRAGNQSGKGFISGFGNSNISSYMKRLFYQILFGIPAVGALVGALSSLVSGLFAVGSAVAPAANALAILPGLAAAAASGIIAAVLAFRGIGEAFKAGAAPAAAAGGTGARAAKQVADATDNAKDRIQSALRGVRDAQEAVAENARNTADAVSGAMRDVRDALEAQTEGIEDAAARVLSAQRGLRDALEQQASLATSTAKAVVAAEKTLAAAQDASYKSQDKINRARRQAADDLIEMQNSVEQASINEGKGLLALEKARREFDLVKDFDPNSKLFREASLNLRQAELSYKEAQKSNVDAVDANAEAQKKGVEGSDAVTSAQQDQVDALEAVTEATQRLKDAQADQAKQTRDSAEAVADARREMVDSTGDQKTAIRDLQESVIDAYKNLREAERDQAKSRRDSLEQLADAQKQLADARKSLATAAAGAAGAAAAGVDKFGRAMAKLSPQAQAFVRYLLSIRDEFRAVKDAAGEELFPKLTTALQTIVGSGFLVDLADGLRMAGGAMGDIAIGIADMLTSESFRESFRAVSKSNVVVLRSFGDTISNLLGIFIKLADAARPVTEEFAAWIATVTGNWLKNMSGDMDGLTAKIKDGAEVAKQLGRIFSLLWDNIKLVGGAARDSGQSLLDSFENALKKLREFLDTPEKNQQMKQYFSDVANNVRALGDLVVKLGEVFIKLGDNEAIAEIAEKFAAAAPVISKLFEESLDAVGPLMADLVTQLLDIFNVLSSNGSGLQAFVKTLDIIAQGLNAILNIPGLGHAVILFAQLFGIWKALSLAASVLQLRRLAAGLGFVVTQSRAFITGARGIQGATTAATARMTAFGQKARLAASALKGFIVQSAQAVASLARQAAAWAVSTARAAANRVQVLLATAAEKARGIAVKVGTAIQWLWNAAMTANPIGLIVAAVAALVAGLVLFFTKTKLGQKIWKSFTDFLSKAWDGITEAFETAWDAIQDGFAWLKKNWKTVLAIITGPIGLAVKFVVDNWDKIKKGAETVVTWIKKNWKTLLAIITGPIGMAVKLVTDHWDKIKEGAVKAKDGIVSAFDKVVTFVKGIPGKIGTALSTTWDKFKASATTAKDWVVARFNSLLDWIKTFPGKFWNGLKTMWDKYREAASGAGSWVREKLNNLIEWAKGFGSRFWNALKNMWTDFREKASSAASWVREKLNDLVSWVKGVPGRFAANISGMWTDFREKASEAKKWVTGKLQDVVDWVKKMPGRISSAATGMWDGLKSAFKSAMNWIIGKWNGLEFKLPKISAFGKTIGGTTLGTPNIPYLANGGIVPATPGGVGAILAEAGQDEKVTPLGSDGLSDGERAIKSAIESLKFTRGEIKIYITAAPGMDIPTLARAVSRELAFTGAA